MPWITAFGVKDRNHLSPNWMMAGKFCPIRVGQAGFIGSAQSHIIRHRVSPQKPLPSVTPWGLLATKPAPPRDRPLT